ncbi:unnamed protein product [Prunus armeniaca]
MSLREGIIQYEVKLWLLYWGNVDVRSKETVMLSYINLLEQLICVSPTSCEGRCKKASNPVESKNGS